MNRPSQMQGSWLRACGDLQAKSLISCPASLSGNMIARATCSAKPTSWPARQALSRQNVSTVQHLLGVPDWAEFVLRVRWVDDVPGIALNLTTQRRVERDAARRGELKAESCRLRCQLLPGGILSFFNRVTGPAALKWLSPSLGFA